MAARDKPSFVWKVTLLRKKEANAYCLPGGKIVVYTGILPVTRHRRRARDRARARGRARDRRARRRANRARAPDQGRGGDHRGWRRVHAEPVRPRSRSTRCRRLGRLSPVHAGRRSPRQTTSAWSTWREPATSRTQALAFWKRMLRASKGKEPPEIASDHPTDQHRIEQIQGWLPEADRAYRPPQG